MTARSVRTPWLALALIAAAGAALRIACAHGGLWLDEAWSAVFARDVATPAGILLGIHHDNNHHLNTLWLQLVGFDAPPVLQRALSIASGTAAIVVAGLFGARRSAAAAIASALLFAVSPMLVTYGSEARGYAPVVLAMLAAVLLTERWLDDRRRPCPALALTLVTLLGMLAQLTFVFALPALAGWVLLRVWGEVGARTAIAATLRLSASASAVAVLLALLIFRLLPPSGTLQFGNYEPFTLANLHAGVRDMIAYTLALPPGPLLVPLAAVAVIAALTLPPLSRRAPFYLLAIVGLPLGVLALQLGNAGIPRYYLLGSTALLLLAGEVAGAAWTRWHPLTTLLLAAFVASGLWQGVELARNRRADTGAAIAAMAQRAPAGAGVAPERERSSAIIAAAAASAQYPVRIARCAPFLFVERDGDALFPDAPEHCGTRYRPIVGGDPTGLSGTHWRLYARE